MSQSNGTMTKMLVGVATSLLIFLLTGFGVNIDNRVRDLEKNEHLRLKDVTELRERIQLIRDRQTENESKIEINRKAIERFRIVLKLDP